MRTQFICLALAIVLLCPPAPGQGLQTGDQGDRHVPRHSIMSTRAFRELPRGLPGNPALHRVKEESISRRDSLRASRVPSHLPVGNVIPNNIQRSRRPRKIITAPQAQFYVIDTATVYGMLDTTRHLYSFNAKAKRTADVTEVLRGGLWVDTLRETNMYDAGGKMVSDLHAHATNGQGLNKWAIDQIETLAFDANGNMLTHVYESWSDGQMAIGERETYTYDAHGNTLIDLYESWSGGQWESRGRVTYTYDLHGDMLTCLSEMWSNGQWVNSARETDTYDANGHTLSKLYESWSNGQWVSNDRDTYTYDENGNTLSNLCESWSYGQ